MKHVFNSFLLIFFLLISFSVHSNTTIQEFINSNYKLISKSSSKTVDPVLNDIKIYNQDDVKKFLILWKSKELSIIKDSNIIVYTEKKEDIIIAYDIFNNNEIGKFTKKQLKSIKPNSGVRSKIDSALVEYQILDEDINVRRESLQSLKRDIQKTHLKILRTAYENEIDNNFREEINKVLNFAILKFSKSEQEKLDVLSFFSNDTSLEVRASLNNLLNTSDILFTNNKKIMGNIARKIIPNKTYKNNDGTSNYILSSYSSNKPELTYNDAYDLLSNNKKVLPRITKKIIKESLVSNIKKLKNAGFDISSLNNDLNRLDAYNYLASINVVPPFISKEEIKNSVDKFTFYTEYNEISSQVTNKTKEILKNINFRVNIYRYIDLFVDGISLSSIYFLGAIGLAITFGVMRVINMAHGEFIMMGAYTGYVVQQYIPNHTISILIALPLAFIITFGAGVLLERMVIRHLYKNPLDTLLATFGVSIALQQLAKNIFGTQARPLTAPSWLDGALSINDDLSISYIRIAIILMGILFLLLLLFIMNRTRLGLEIRAVTQNPIMASNMGINPDRINMLTFGFGSAIAGIAGVAIGLFSKVTSELGTEYIVQSFMTVVVGGVGNIFGTLAGAALIGFLQKIIEWFNPSNTLAAQTYMIIFIILFIQFRPRGIFALKGRVKDV
ncbi:urea ABC transporter permease subunit UrtB [Pelagibacteraceae bacterium]|nr:urea ABC transporter permease subunit UrtB [Pelagibacteraceae bacterium]